MTGYNGFNDSDRDNLSGKTVVEGLRMPGKILLVDDEPKTLKYLSRYLLKKGFEVFTAENGEEAFILIQDESLDVVVLDVLMPGMDGMTVLKRIKQISPVVQVIILTGCASATLGMQGMRDGAFDFMTKPVDPPELTRLINSALEYRRYLEQGINSVDLPEME
jgi:DNA-binding NtrC family response regulator